jgi:hypothetical protein
LATWTGRSAEPDPECAWSPKFNKLMHLAGLGRFRLWSPSAISIGRAALHLPRLVALNNVLPEVSRVMGGAQSTPITLTAIRLDRITSALSSEVLSDI